MEIDHQIDLAEQELEQLCSDYSAGKPSEEDVRRYADGIAYKRKLSVSYDEYGNPTFSAP